MEDRPDWAFGVFTAEAIEAKRKYYMSLRTEADRIAEQKCLKREEVMLNRPRPVSPHAKPERNQAIWKERKEQGTTLSAIAEKYGLTRERVRQIVAKEDRLIARRAFFDELRKQKEGATHGG
jgi:DNA-directed RNA polymerase specialized sigma subunit